MYTESLSYFMFELIQSVSHTILHMNTSKISWKQCLNTEYLYYKHMAKAKTLLHCIRQYPFALYQAIPFCIVSGNTLLHCIRQYPFALYQAIPFCIVSGNTLLHCIRQYPFALYQAIPFCIVSGSQNWPLHDHFAASISQLAVIAGEDLVKHVHA